MGTFSDNTYLQAIAVGRTAAAITPSDTNDLLVNQRAIPAKVYVGGAGNVAVIPADGTTAVTFTAPPVGSVLPVLVKRVMVTNTTATLLVALR